MTVGDLLQCLAQIEDTSMPVHIFYHGEVREKSDDVFIGRSSGRADLPKGKRICVITGSCNRSEKTMILSGMAGVEYERSYQATHWTENNAKERAETQVFQLHNPRQADGAAQGTLCKDGKLCKDL